MTKKPTPKPTDEQQGELFGPRAVDWGAVYEDEVAAAEDGVLFQPGCVPQKGKKLEHVIDLDPPGQPHWLSGLTKQRRRRRRGS